MERPRTPPKPQPISTSKQAASPPTPEVTRRIEESRLRAKALRDRRETEQQAGSDNTHSTGSIVGTKRPYTSISRAEIPASNRDARATPNSGPNAGPGAPRPGQGPGAADDLRPLSRKFTKYVDYNFSAMTDTKGGFLSTEDDPWNKSMSVPSATGGKGPPGAAEQKPAHMTAAEWERMQLIKKLQKNKSGPFEPSLGVLVDEKTRKRCRECRSIEIDFVWEEVFSCVVCNTCKEKYPEKYSLLTKTECKEDYLLTDPELKDPELLPHLSKPNPHKSHWHDMMLFLRYQVEEYAFKHKWGSSEALDAEFEKREADKKRRKEAKFKEKLLDLKRKTRTDAFRRNNAKSGISGGIGGGSGTGKAAKFGDAVGGAGKHVHEWGRTVENEDGMTVKTCLTCNMEVEELEF